MFIKEVYSIHSVTNKMGGEGYHNNIDEVIPLFDIKIETTREITEARDIDNNPLQLSRENGITTITLPKLEQYQIVTLRK